MMMMNQMMSQQMAQQQMQMVQMNNMMGKSAVSGSGGKRPKKPAVNIKSACCLHQLIEAELINSQAIRSQQSSDANCDSSTATSSVR